MKVGKQMPLSDEEVSKQPLCAECGYAEGDFRHWLASPNHYRHPFRPAPSVAPEPPKELCPTCGTAVKVAPGIGPYCPNKKCWRSDNLTGPSVAPEPCICHDGFGMNLSCPIHSPAPSVAPEPPKVESCQICGSPERSHRNQLRTNTSPAWVWCWSNWHQAAPDAQPSPREAVPKYWGIAYKKASGRAIAMMERFPTKESAQTFLDAKGFDWLHPVETDGTIIPVFPKAGEAAQEEAGRKAFEDAFKEAMGALDMPEDNTAAFDEWLFNKGWQAALAHRDGEECIAETELCPECELSLIDGTCMMCGWPTAQKEHVDNEG